MQLTVSTTTSGSDDRPNGYHDSLSTMPITVSNASSAPAAMRARPTRSDGEHRQPRHRPGEVLLEDDLAAQDEQDQRQRGVASGVALAGEPDRPHDEHGQRAVADGLHRVVTERAVEQVLPGQSLRSLGHVVVQDVVDQRMQRGDVRQARPPSRPTVVSDDPPSAERVPAQEPGQDEGRECLRGDRQAVPDRAGPPPGYRIAPRRPRGRRPAAAPDPASRTARSRRCCRGRAGSGSTAPAPTATPDLARTAAAALAGEQPSARDVGHGDRHLAQHDEAHRGVHATSHWNGSSR